MRLLRRACLLLTGAIALNPAAAESSQSPGASEVVAMVGDAHIVDAELDRWWRTQDASTYQRFRREAYDGRRRALDALLAEQLLSAEAGKEGIAVAGLLEREVDKRVKPVTDADVSAFVASNPMPPGTPISMVAPLVAALLGQRAREAAKEEYLNELRRAPGARVRVFLEPPRVSVPRAPYNPTRGPAAAPVEIVVFSDFECPFCRRAEPVLNRLRERFPTDVLFVWRHYPLSIHQRASPAAEAAQCAHDQGHFWAFHDALFDDQTLLQPAGLMMVAERLGLDTDVFGRCVSTHAHAADVSSDSDAGERAGVGGTPTVFINGVAFVGALSFEAYERAVLDELARLPGRSAPQSETPR